MNRFGRLGWYGGLALAALVAAATVAPTGTASAACTLLLGAPATYGTGLFPSDVLTGDFNQDGVVDLVVVNEPFSTGYPSYVSILIGHGSGGVGDGTFLPAVNYPIGDQLKGSASRDFNGDGIADLAVTSYGDNRLAVLLGNGTGGVGDGTFGPPTYFPTAIRPFHVLAHDLNGDGILDLAISNNGVPSISVMLGLGSGGVGNGTFAPHVDYPLAGLSTGIEAGDFNDDGILDLVASENLESSVAVLLGNGSGGGGDGTFAPAVHYPTGEAPYAISIADFNGDGISDLAVSKSAYAGVAILLGGGTAGHGDGTFGAPTIFASGDNSSGTAVADFDQDGILDLASGDPTGNVITILRGLGSGGVGDGTFEIQHSYPAGPYVIHPVAADFNGDGRPDVALTNYSDDYISVLLGTCEEDLRFPKLTQVKDVPNDNGGRVFLTWTRSSLDATGGPVNAYRIWRRVPENLALAWRTESAAPPADIRTTSVVRPDGSTEIVYWEAMGQVPAQRLDGYGFIAPTLQDSMRGSNPYTAFFVTALTPNIDVFYASNVDSGYSGDNLKPHGPNALQAVYGAAGVKLSWDPNEEADLSGYRLYRGASRDFVPSDANLVATLPDTGYLDPAGSEANAYKLSAVDVHGNESDFSEVFPEQPTAVGGSIASFALEGVSPNPVAVHDFSIAFSLPGAAAATIEIIDAAGRRVLAQSVVASPGRQVVKLHGAPLASGVYWVRLTQGARSLAKRFVVL